MNCITSCCSIFGTIYTIYCVLFCCTLCKTEYDERRQIYTEMKEEYDNIEITIQQVPLHTIEEVEEE